MDISKLDFEEIKKKIESLPVHHDESAYLDKVLRYLALKRVEVNQLGSVLDVLRNLGISFNTMVPITELAEYYKSYRKPY